jgi:polar amino acid transport system substrate-binding protein
MWKSVAIALSLLTVAAASTASADEKIAVDDGTVPFMYADAQKAAAGVYPALVREAFKRMGVPAQVSALPWKRALAGLDTGENAIAGLYMNNERKAKYDFSEKLYEETLIVYVPKAKSIPLNGFASLKGMTVGVVRGWSYGDEFDAMVKAGDVKAEEAGSESANLQKLTHGRLNAVLATREAGLDMGALANEGEAIVALEPPLLVNAAYLAFAKTASKTDLIKTFDKTLASMRGDGTVASIVAAELGKQK